MTASDGAPSAPDDPGEPGGGAAAPGSEPGAGAGPGARPGIVATGTGGTPAGVAEAGPARSIRPASAADTRLLRRTRMRLVLWSGGITLAVLVVLGAMLWTAVRTSLESDSVAQLRSRADVIVRVIARVPLQPTIDPSRAESIPELRLGFGGGNAGTLALVVRPDDVVIASATATEIGLPEQAGVQAARNGAVDIRATDISGLPVRVLSEPVRFDGATYVVQVVGDRSAEVRTLGALLTVLALGGLLALALALIGGWFYAARALVPIRESLRRQRAFAADASHELRTPLAVVRGNIEYLQRHPSATVGSLRPALDDISGEVDELTRLVEDLLLLARADSGTIELGRERVDLADVAAGALGSLAGVAEERHVALRLDAVPCAILGDPGRLRQVVTILVDNAIRHSPGGGTVAVTAGSQGHDVFLRVDDEGPGIREEDRPHLFERFWRAADAPEGGVGLGLSIAAWIVELHGGSISGASRPDRRGARFEVRLPSTRT